MLFINSRIINAQLEEIFEFFSNVEIWEKAVPHCKRMEVVETQTKDDLVSEKIKMVVTSKTGCEEEFLTQRWKVKNRVITYNQLTPPDPIALHAGEWKFEEVQGGVEVTSIHLISVHNSLDNFPQFKNYAYSEIETLVKESISHNSEQIIEVCAQMLTGS